MDQKAKLLIVEDEESIREGLVDVFTYHGYEVKACDNGKGGLNLALIEKYDLIILDIMLPGMDGFSVCQELRSRNYDALIFMLTAKSNEDDIINGLSLGADDYITKPFSIKELLLRAEISLKRTKKLKYKQKQFEVADKILIDPNTLSGKNGEKIIEFSRKEIEILNYLSLNQERAVSREELLAEVWGYQRAENIETRTVDIHIAKIRRKIESSPKKPEFLITERGEGYRLISKHK